LTKPQERHKLIAMDKHIFVSEETHRTLKMVAAAKGISLKLLLEIMANKLEEGVNLG